MRSDSTIPSTLAEQEYGALRATIAHRGTVRIVIAPMTVAAWAGLALLQLAYAPLPLATLVSLLMLAAGFEAVHALHVGVERIGRYLQVFYEETSANTSVKASWETTAMSGGPALPGGGIDPLFTLVFSGAILGNLAIALVPWPTATEAGFVGLFHLLVLARIVGARMAAGKQRARDLAHYRHLKDSRL